MHLKRILIALIGLSIILAFCTSCANDRDRDETEPTLNIEDLSRTYALRTLFINSSEAGSDAKVKVTVDKDLKATFELYNVIEDNPEVMFETTLTKKESGAYAFKYSNYVVENDLTGKGKTYILDGALVGSSESNITLVTTLDLVELVSIEELLRVSVFNKTSLYINEKMALNSISSINPQVRLTQLKDEDQPADNVSIRFSFISFVSSGNIEKVIQLKKGEKLGTWSFDEIEHDDDTKHITFSGFFDGYELHLTMNTIVKTDFIGKWNMATKSDISSLAIDLRFKDAPTLNAPYSTKLKNIGEKIFPIIFKDFCLDFKDTGKVLLTYSNNTGTHEFPTEVDYSHNNQNLVSRNIQIGLSDDAITSLLEKDTSLTVKLVNNLLPSTYSGGYRYMQFSITDNAEERILKHTSTNGVKGLFGLAKLKSPTTVEGFKKLGVDFLTQEDIDELHKMYTDIEEQTITAASSISIGVKKVQ